MGDFTYKEYSEEENKIYHEAMDKIMDSLRKGLRFHEACSTAHVEDKELKRFIEDDALKIIIADMYFVKGLSLQNVADTLQVSIDTISKANSEMLEDVEIMATEMYKMNNPDSPEGNV